MSHRNIALFVANAGCPHRCTFCNQFSITGEPETAQPEDVHAAMRTALQNGQTGGQIAFFGGSFTAVPRPYLTALLEAAAPYVEDGSVSGIRISTRPDAIDEDILRLLEKYHVTAVELGAQSMSDEVLRKNRRGHTAEDVETASRAIQAHGMELGLQMMTGLYGSTEAEDLATADRLIALHPDTVRIYPTLVMEGTELARLYRQGRYVPQTLEEAVRTCAGLLRRFHGAGIPVIRLGLHSGGGVEDGYLAGPWHPAFRELCEGRIYYEAAAEQLKRLPKGRYRLFVAPSEISKMTGQKRKNIIELEKHQFRCSVRPDSALQPYQIRIEAEGT